MTPPPGSMATPAATAPPKAGAKNAPPAPNRPFRAGTQSMEDAQYDQSYTLTASTHKMQDFLLNGDGYLRGIWCLYEMVTSGNSATVTYAQDGPFTIVDTIQFVDTSNRPVFGPFNGYTWMAVMKWGGYFNQNDPRADVVYTATAGAGGTGGSFTIMFYIPIEIVSRDTLGALVNKNTAVPYKVNTTVSASATPYGTPPTTAGTLRIRMVQDNWWEPETTDAKGHPLAQQPPAVNTTQFWASNNYVVNAGAVPGLQLSTGLGYPIRNLIFSLYDSANSRSQGDADWPDPVTLTVEKNQLFIRNKKFWQSRVAKAFDLLIGGPDAARTLENGVYPVWFNQDFNAQPGQELRNGYLITRGGQNFLFTGTIGGSGSHTLFTYVNWVAPANGDPASLAPGGSR